MMHQFYIVVVYNMEPLARKKLLWTFGLVYEASNGPSSDCIFSLASRIPTQLLQVFKTPTQHSLFCREH